MVDKKELLQEVIDNLKLYMEKKDDISTLDDLLFFNQDEAPELIEKFDEYFGHSWTLESGLNGYKSIKDIRDVNINMDYEIKRLESLEKVFDKYGNKKFLDDLDKENLSIREMFTLAIGEDTIKAKNNERMKILDNYKSELKNLGVSDDDYVILRLHIPLLNQSEYDYKIIYILQKPESKNIYSITCYGKREENRDILKYEITSDEDLIKIKEGLEDGIRNLEVAKDKIRRMYPQAEKYIEKGRNIIKYNKFTNTVTYDPRLLIKD